MQYQRGDGDGHPRDFSLARGVVAHPHPRSGLQPGPARPAYQTADVPRLSTAVRTVWDASNERKRPSMSAQTYTARRRQQVERAAKEWRSALIDVSGNNRLLFFKPTAATLDLADASPTALAELLAGSAVRLSRLYPDPPRLASAQRAVKQLAGKQREFAEEYGVAVAFCALGIATWSRTPGDVISETEDDDLDAAPGETGDGQPAHEVFEGRSRFRGAGGRAPAAPAAPVLLRAVEFNHTPGSDAWELTLTGEAQLNPVLVHVFAAQGVHLDEEETLDAGDDTRGGLAPIFERLSKACAEVPGFGIDERLMLGAFSYLKQPMVADCEDIEALISSDLVAALAGDEQAIAGVRSLAGEVDETDPDYKPVASEFLVLDADASQSFVVNAALAGRNLVVQGPPGTGKSQTISNVIAALVADGKRVLFVAQKRAAITAVLDRLEAVGLGEVTLDLFAAGASRRYVAEQIGKVLERQSSVGEPVTAALHQALGASRDRLVSHRDALHIKQHAWGVTVAQLLAVAAAIPSSAASKLRLPTQTLSAWRPIDLEAHASNLGELAGKGGLEPDRLTRASWSPAALISADRVAAANEVLISVSSELLPVAVDALGNVAAEFGVVAQQTRQQATVLLSGLAEAAELERLIPGALDPGIEPAAFEQLLAATDKTYRKSHEIKFGFGQRRKIRNSAHAAVSPAVHGEPSDAGVHQLFVRAKAAREDWAKASGSGPVRSLAALPAAQAAVDALTRGLAVLQESLQHLPLDEASFSDLSDILGALAADRSRAQFPRLHELETGLTAAGLTQVLASLRKQAADLQTGLDRAPLAVANMLRHIAVRSALDQALTTDPALAGVTGDELNAASNQFQRCDDEHMKANAARVRRVAAARLTAALNANEMQHLILKKEVTAKRNFKPIRTLFEQAPNVITAVKPVWAMSPLQVSRLLPAAPCFDVVIFDEASQVKPADAIPALIRAPQAIVAGDSRQLPPTEFFTKVLEDVPDAPLTGKAAAAAEQEALAAEAAAEDAELGAAVKQPPAQRPVGESYTRDAESILFAFDRVLAGQSRRLLWHYRSRDERLIAVSNTYVYDRSLTTFPAADFSDVLGHEIVAASPGIKGGTNSPDAEVQRVVDLVIDHARTRPDQTLGVITFGIPHTRRIEAALDARFVQDPELKQILDADPREPFFVKNIERVQGDERDTIILTVGYGKTPEGKLNLFWGPLLKPGGERRLNVAISRARARLVLVTSFRADDVAEDAHASAGFKLMWQFLRFMASGGTDLSDDGRRTTPMNAFEIDIHDRLTEAGLDLVPQLGVGRYRLDFAARHLEHPGRYVLAIEADGAAYHSGHVARERDRLRQRLLESRGWTFHRIWSTDWFNDPVTEIARTVAAFDAAVSAQDNGDDDLANNACPEVESGPEDQLSEEAPAWHIADAKRTMPRPGLVRGWTIDRYEPTKLVQLVRHLRSDGVLRTRDDELALLMRELGFTKRGSRIVAVLTAAQGAAG